MGFWARLVGSERPVAVEESAHAVQPDVTRRGYEYGIQAGGVATDERARAVAATRQQVMDQLYQAYLACAPASACVDTTARMVTAGGLQLVPEDEGNANDARPPAIQHLDALMRYTNSSEDMIQLCRSTITDLLTFGDGFIEVGEVGSVPAALWTIDGTTCTVKSDDHGELLGYHQQVDGQRFASFTPEEVIHVSLDSPRGGVYGVSPMQKLMVPITAWLFTSAVLKEYMRQGMPHRFAVDLGKGTQIADVERWLAQYRALNLGARNQGNPVVTTVHAATQAGAPPLHEFQASHVGDLLATLDKLRDQIVSGFGMSPAMIGIIESGNLGGGTGESQARTFHFGTVVPLQNLLLEKLNYRLLTSQGITGWKFQFGEVEYRDTATIEAQAKSRIDTGQWTVNKARANIGEPPVPGGDEAAFVLSRAVVAVADIADSSKATLIKDSGGALGSGGKPAAKQESAAVRDARRLNEAWKKEYAAQLAKARRELKTLDPK